MLLLDILNGDHQIFTLVVVDIAVVDNWLNFILMVLVDGLFDVLEVPHL